MTIGRRRSAALLMLTDSIDMIDRIDGTDVTDMKNINKNTAYAAALLLFCCCAMAFVDIVITPPYFLRSLMKLFFFLVIPVAFMLITRMSGLRSLFSPSRRGILFALGIGGAVFCIIFGGYFLLGSFFDLSGITESLANRAGIGSDNFIFVALYISFINSLLEEAFFRGFAFTVLRPLGRAPAYILSALAFSLYHVSIMIGWFGLPLYSLILGALFVGGLIFNYACEKSRNIYVPWMIHMAANFAINGIGLILLSGA